MANPKGLAYFSLITILLFLGNLFQNIHATINNNTTTHIHRGFSLRLIHRDSPESPLYRANLTDATRRKEHIRLSNRRLESLARLGNNKSSDKTINPNDDVVRLPMRIDDYIHYVQLGIGTFDDSSKFQYIYLGIDTASGLIWTQCENCVNCFHQIIPYYPASQSQSYSQLPCSECPPTGECVDNTCRLSRRYGDGSVVVAIAARETFYLESDPDLLALDEAIFGCGIDMQGFSEGDDENNKVSGIFGMSLGDLGFIKQAESLVKGKFSYCLQKFQKGTVPPMYLRFGDDVRPPVSTLSTVPMLQNPKQPSYYYLDLRGIRVGNKDLVLPSGVFDIKEDGNGGCIIDTGTPYSRLTTEAYRVFKDEVAAHIESSNTNVVRFDDPRIHNAGGFGLHCLTIGESTQDAGSLSILGSDHQVDHRIIYDIPNKQLQFGNEDCSQGR
ncbi:aspartic proteinase nepenthesin-2-like [Chenopodium quinoa]|uniref:aspartic proteinase nepenthesin-2-like n=1 Tax=Chenopodium quinoa TaxID=63459 RepID=UPI000B77A02C|nr:aspartic proteinase nepenthesin-2-like [Chenopodium quinoa]